MKDKSEFVDMKLASELNLVDENKVDWKGRSALKFKYGGMKVALLILGKEIVICFSDN